MSSSRSERRSRRKHSEAGSYTSASTQPESHGENDTNYEAHAEFESISAYTWPPPSFLFAVNELPVNEEPQNGGVLPQYDNDQLWLPPESRAGFGPQHPGQLYRWSNNGEVSLADDCYFSEPEGIWRSRTGFPIEPYNVSSMFYCNNLTQFRVASGDVSTRDMADSANIEGLDRWWLLQFAHDDTLTRVNRYGPERVVAGKGAWVKGLGLKSYREDDTTARGGLAGDLTLIIALIAFSCRPGMLDTILLQDRAWMERRWNDHGHRHGRLEARGVVVTVYLDPENLQGSTRETMNALEWQGERLM